MMQDVRELGYLICKKMVPPHGRTCRGRDGMNFLSLFFFFLFSFNFDDKLVLWKEETSGRAGALSLPSGQQGQGAAG